MQIKKEQRAQELSDLELTRLAAEAMGYSIMRGKKPMMPLLVAFKDDEGREWTKEFSPLTDDGDAMALVKRFGLYISPAHRNKGGWTVRTIGNSRGGISTGNINLNRAIVALVALTVCGFPKP